MLRLYTSKRALSTTFLRLNKVENFHLPDSACSNDASSQPDALATTMTQKYDHERLSHVSDKTDFKATWLNALAERKKQMKLGKIIDSYSYKTPKSTAVGEKTREESFSYLTLPFREDAMLTDFYVNAAGRIRIGQLFQDLDALAGRIAYRHTSPAEPVNVTASVDRIYMLKNIENIKDWNVVLSGSVVWTGRSSMEITVKASAFEGDIPAEITEASLDPSALFMTSTFTFVARNPETRKSLAINKLLPTNEKEWLEFRRAESHNAAKKLNAASLSLTRNPPTTEESRMIHKLWTASNEIEAIKNKKNVEFMKDTEITSTLFMQPQYRNRHSYMIFGGYLMRQTFELAYCCAAKFSHALPRFVSLDSTTFSAPVPVGSVLNMTATVSNTDHIHERDVKPTIVSLKDAEDPTALFDFEPKPANQMFQTGMLTQPGTLIQVKVDTTVQELNSRDASKSGSFIYSFFVPRDTEGVVGEPGYATVLPQAYSEMVEYVDGRRRALDTASYVTDVLKLN